MNTIRCEQIHVALHLACNLEARSWDALLAHLCQKKNPPRATFRRRMWKMRSPEISCKNKMRSYVGENDSQHIRALALGLDWHSSPRVTSYFTFHIPPGFAFSGIQRHVKCAGLDLPNTFSSCIIISIARRFTQ